MFKVFWNTIVGWGCLFALANSYYRLEGYVDNGLRWKTKEKKIRKYDFTSEFEEKTFWKHLRLRI